MNRRYRSLLIALAFIAFVSLGLPDGILGVAWPSIRRTFGVPLSQLGYLLMAGTTGYFVSSFFAGSFERRLGIGGVLLASNLLVLASLLGNSITPAFPWMILFSLLGGLGAGAIDAAINHFAASTFPPRWVSWLHACYGIGATLGPLIMTTVIVRGLSWRYGYASVGVIIAAMSILFLLTIKLWQTDPVPNVSDAQLIVRAGVTDALRIPLVWMHIALFFLYTGIEVTAGQWFYSLFTESRGMSPKIAGTIVSSYWASLTIGRIVFGYAAGHFKPVPLLRIALGLAPLAALLIWANVSTSTTFIGAAVLGFALAPIYPLLVSVTPSRVGQHVAAHAIGFQVSAATIGVAVLPTIAGALARRIGLEVIGPFLLAATLSLLILHEITMLRTRRQHLQPAVGAAT
ncbi:MAG: MFS transporter [Anaerolineae bacterium]|nr:MFS transporter [Phycisphaerae bacterium]